MEDPVATVPGLAGMAQNGSFSNADWEKVYQGNLLGGGESRSGSGSTIDQTATLQAELPNLLAELEVKRVLDLPCGDFNWMRNLEWKDRKYIGADVVPGMIKKNISTFGSENIQFEVLDVTSDSLPNADIIICRDLLVHLKFDLGIKAIDNMLRSGAKYLLATTFTDRADNTDDFYIWRPLNLEKKPFNFPKPSKILNESCTEVRLAESYSDKSLGLWLLQDIRDAWTAN